MFSSPSLIVANVRLCISHRHGDHLPVVWRHVSRIIGAGEESHAQCGPTGEPAPQQLCHDPHVRSHEWWVFVPVCAVSTLPFPLNLSLSFHLPPNSRLPLQHTYTRVCCACFSPPLIQIIFASRNGNEVHLRAERVRLQRACCSLSV